MSSMRLVPSLAVAVVVIAVAIPQESVHAAQGLKWKCKSGDVIFTHIKDKQWQLVSSSGNTTDMTEVSSGEYTELASRSGQYRARLYPTYYRWKSPNTPWEYAGEGAFIRE